MKFNILFSKYCGNHKLLQNVWKREIVEANTEKEAISFLLEKHNRDGKKVNAILSCN